MSSAPITAASLADARLSQLQSRMTFLWSAAHSPLAMLQPRVAAGYIRQMRLLAFHSDVQIAQSHTQLNCCSKCNQVAVPGLNANVRLKPSKEALRRERRKARSKRKRATARLDQQAAAAALDADAPGDASATDSDAVPRSADRKRRRSPSAPRTPSTASKHSEASGSAFSSSSAGASSAASSYTPTDIVSTCLTCGHSDRAPALSSRQRMLLEQSNTDLSALIAQAAAHEEGTSELEQRDNNAKKQKLLHSLQSQSAPQAAVAALRPTLSSLQTLAAAQQRFAQSKQALTSEAIAASAASSSSAAHSFTASRVAPASSSFFATQFKDAAGIVSPPPSAPTASSKPFSFTASGAAKHASGAAASSAPFSFSKSGAAPAKPTGSLYAALQQLSAPSAIVSSHSISPLAAFSAARAAAPATPSAKSKAAAATPVSSMQGIAIVGGMKKPATTPIGKGQASGKKQKR